MALQFRRPLKFLMPVLGIKKRQHASHEYEDMADCLPFSRCTEKYCKTLMHFEIHYMHIVASGK